MKNNYPIKYTIMPILECKNWQYDYDEQLKIEYQTICYIVSKCYLISEKIRYKENGLQSQEYEVVFPYQMINFFTYGISTPSFNYFENKYNNSHIVYRIFDSFEDANEYAIEKNNELYKEILLSLPNSNDNDDKLIKFNQTLSKYKKLEQKILENTTDINNTNRKVLDKILHLDSNGNIVLTNFTLYETISLFSNKRYIVYSISKEQYNKVLEAIKANDINTIKNIINSSSIILIHENENSDIKIINKDNNCSHCINANGRLSVCNDFNNFDLLDNSFEIFYTTETLNDILCTYKTYEDINLFESPILKRIN